MYLVNKKLPKDCFECEYRTKCDVWQAFLRLPIDMAEIKMEDMELLKPMRYRNCKIHKIPKFISRFYFKFILKKCQHICRLCKHKKQCEIYQYGEENVN